MHGVLFAHAVQNGGIAEAAAPLNMMHRGRSVQLHLGGDLRKVTILREAKSLLRIMLAIREFVIDAQAILGRLRGVERRILTMPWPAGLSTKEKVEKGALPAAPGFTSSSGFPA